MASPESWAAEDVVPSAPAEGDEALLAGEPADEGSPEQAESVDAPAAQESSAERAARLNTRKMARLYEQLVDGDESVRTQLEADKDGRRMLRARERDLARTQASLPHDAQQIQNYQYWQAKDKAEDYEFIQQMRNPAFRKWYDEQMPAWLARTAQPQGAASAGNPLQTFYDALLATPDNRALTDAEKDDLDPDNFEHLPVGEAMSAMANAYALITARRAAAKVAAPVEARRQAQAREADGIANAQRHAMPQVGGRPPSQLSDSQIIDAFNAQYRERGKVSAIDQHLQDQYQALRRRRGFPGA